MLLTLTLAGLRAGNGTHTLNPKPALTVFSGPSGAGKSTTIAAALAPLTGDYLSTDSTADATYTYADGSVVTIRQTRKTRSFKLVRAGRVIYDDNGVEAFRREFGGVADPAHEDVLRAIVTPGRALNLRSDELVRLLARVTPTADLAATVRGIVGDAFDPALVTSNDADALVDALKKAQHAANKARDEAKGRLDAAVERVKELRDNEAPPVDEDAVIAAQAWIDYDAAKAKHDAAETARAAAAEWDAKLAALGKRPEPDAGEIQVKRIALDKARAELRAAEEAERNAAEQARIEKVRAETEARVRAEVVAAPAPVPTPTPKPSAPAPVLFTAIKAVRLHDCPSCTCPVEDADV